MTALQKSYLNKSRDVLLVDSVEMGAGLALHFSKAVSRLDRQESKSGTRRRDAQLSFPTAVMPNIGGWSSDCSNLVVSQFAAKNYYTGELSGARHILGQGARPPKQLPPLTMLCRLAEPANGISGPVIRRRAAGLQVSNGGSGIEYTEEGEVVLGPRDPTYPSSSGVSFGGFAEGKPAGPSLPKTKD